MGRDTLIEEPWCHTCGKSISEKKYNINGGECDYCLQWWKDNVP